MCVVGIYCVLPRKSESSRALITSRASLTVIPVVYLLLANKARKQHKPWFDEAQAWLIARDNTLAKLLYHRLRREGHPPLWYLLLWVATRTVRRYSYLQVIGYLAGASGALFFLFFSP